MLLHGLLFTAHTRSDDNGRLGPNWPVLQTINSVLQATFIDSPVCLCVCVYVCVSSQSSALLWPSLETSWLGIGGNGSRLVMHQNAQHEQRHLKHTVTQPVVPSEGHSFTDVLLWSDTMSYWGTKSRMYFYTKGLKARSHLDWTLLR